MARLSGSRSAPHLELALDATCPNCPRIDDGTVLQPADNCADNTLISGVVIYLPGAPDVWAGTVALVPGERVQMLSVDAGVLLDTLCGLGKGAGARWRGALESATQPSPGA
ncbi:MAG: hypothetical protein ABIR94_14320 [Rubrivivax sp.]